MIIGARRREVKQMYSVLQLES